MPPASKNGDHVVLSVSSRARHLRSCVIVVEVGEDCVDHAITGPDHDSSIDPGIGRPQLTVEVIRQVTFHPWQMASQEPHSQLGRPGQVQPRVEDRMDPDLPPHPDGRL